MRSQRARYPEVEGRELPQKVEVVLAPFGDVVEIVAGGDGRAGHQKQHLMQRIHHPCGFPLVLQFGEMLQQQRQTGAWDIVVERHLGPPRESRPKWNHSPKFKAKSAKIAR